VASFLLAQLIATTFGRLFESISNWHVPNVTRGDSISSPDDFAFSNSVLDLPYTPCPSAEMIVPTCPPITDMDLLLRVRTHPTHQAPLPMNDTWGDTDRLQEIGAQVIHMALTTHFFNQRPSLEAEQIRVRDQLYCMRQPLLNFAFRTTSSRYSRILGQSGNGLPSPS
jgi:hypothetical protein